MQFSHDTRYLIFRYLILMIFILSAAPLAAKEAPLPHIISRTEWGAKPPTRAYGSHKISHITVHHQGVVTSLNQDAAKRLRTMQAFHQSSKRGFADISYHFVIDQKGNIYEGRPTHAPGKSKTDYNPAGHLLICLLGDFNVQEPTEAQLKALTFVLRWSLQQWRLPPDTIKGHRDYAHTDCPGKNLYRLLPQLIAALSEN